MLAPKRGTASLGDFRAANYSAAMKTGRSSMYVQHNTSVATLLAATIACGKHIQTTDTTVCKTQLILLFDAASFETCIQIMEQLPQARIQHRGLGWLSHVFTRMSNPEGLVGFEPFLPECSNPTALLGTLVGTPMALTLISLLQFAANPVL